MCTWIWTNHLWEAQGLSDVEGLEVQNAEGAAGCPARGKSEPRTAESSVPGRRHQCEKGAKRLLMLPWYSLLLWDFLS